MLLPSLAIFLVRKRPNPAKNSPYECGFEPFNDARMPFDVRYYLVAILIYHFRFRNSFFSSLGGCFSQIRLVWHGAMGFF